MSGSNGVHYTWFNPHHQTSDVTTDEPVFISEKMNEFKTS